jgi:hypothetical protein
MFAKAGQQLPVGRVGEADDLAETYLYLMRQGFSTRCNDCCGWRRRCRLTGVWGATEQKKTGLSTDCRQPLDRRDVNIERLGAVPYILSLVQLVELPGRPNCTSRFLATLRARVG